ncbi:MAG: hypothetical protein RL701_4971 [Pseudomonadota bacterium]|jgi:hypothetical protein
MLAGEMCFFCPFVAGVNERVVRAVKALLTRAVVSEVLVQLRNILADGRTQPRSESKAAEPVALHAPR